MSDKNINVLHLISSLEMGGAEKLLVELLKNAGSQYGNFTVVVMNDKTNEELKKELLSTGYKVYFLNRKESHKHPKYLFQLLNIINKHKINIIHSHNYGSKHWAILCKIFNPKIKLVFTLHSMGIFDNYSKIKLFLHRKFIDKNIAISDVVMKDANNFGVSKTKRIYNGIELKKYISKINNKNDCLNIINVSRITHKIKGQDILIKALKECKNKGIDFVCNFVGGVYDYDKESFEYLQKLVNELDLKENINFLGNRNDIPELLSNSDLFILPSRCEGLGLAILEAMASKIPVIASNVDGPAELITNEETGLLFESENYKDLAGKIKYLYDNRESMGVLVENAYKFVQDFDILVMCENYNELYKSLI